MSIMSVTFEKAGAIVFSARVDDGFIPSGDTKAQHERAAQAAMLDWEHGRRHHPDTVPAIDYDEVVVAGARYPAAARRPGTV